MSFGLIIAALALWSPSASAECARIGDVITCTESTRGSVITTDKVRVTINGNISNIPDIEEFGDCPVSLPTLIVGDGSSVVNNGSVVGFGLCGAGIVSGDDASVVNAGNITTTGTLADAIAVYDRGTIRLSGTTRTGGGVSHGVYAINDLKITIDQNALLATSGLASSGIYAGASATIVNNGAIRTAGLAGHGIQLLDYSTPTRPSAGQAMIINTGVIDARGERSRAILVTASELMLTNTGVISAIAAQGTRFIDLSRGVEVTAGNMTLTNMGLIRGAGLGITASLSNGATLSNTGTIAALEARGRAIEIAAKNISITNSGIITGGVLGLGVTGVMTLDNDGTIETVSAPSGSEQVIALHLRGSSGGNRVENRGVIATRLGGKAIVGSDGNDEIFNAKTIEGDVDLGGGDDLFQMFTNATLNGRLSGGAGLDRLNLVGSGNIGFTTDGIESLAILGSGAWTLRSRLTIADSVFLLTGELAVAGDGRLDAGRLLVNQGTMLSGSGTIAGTVLTSGTLSPGPGIATLTIAGDLIQDASSTLRVDIAASGLSDRLAVSGQATIGGTLALTPLPGTRFRGGESYDILTAGSGVSGAFASISGLSSAFITSTLARSADNRRLTLNIARLPYSAIAQGQTQQNLASALDAASAAGRTGLSPLLDQLDSWDAGQARQTFDQLAPRVAVAVANTTDAAGRAVRADIMPWLASAGDHSRLRVWGSANHRQGSPSQGDAAAAYEFQIRGITAGFDSAINDDTRIGLGISSQSGHVDQRSVSGNAELDYVFVTGYGLRAWNNFTLAGGIIWGDGDLASQRAFAAPLSGTLTARFDSASLGAFATASARYDIGSVIVTPRVGLEAWRTRVSAFRETGPWALQLERNANSSLRPEMGVEITTHPSRASPYLNVGVSHEVSNQRRMFNARFVADPATTFAIVGLSARRTWATTQVGVRTDLGHGVLLTMAFDGNLTDATQGQRISAGLVAPW